MLLICYVVRFLSCERWDLCLICILSVGKPDLLWLGYLLWWSRAHYYIGRIRDSPLPLHWVAAPSSGCWQLSLWRYFVINLSSLQGCRRFLLLLLLFSFILCIHPWKLMDYLCGRLKMWTKNGPLIKLPNKQLSTFLKQNTFTGFAFTQLMNSKQVWCFRISL